jgi:hypothetical protein
MLTHVDTEINMNENDIHNEQTFTLKDLTFLLH